MKKCFKCGVEKPPSEFYKHSGMADGHVNKCKQCNKNDVKANRAAKSDHYRQYDHQRNKLPHRKEARKEYRRTQSGRTSEATSCANWRFNNPKKRRVHTMTRKAIKSGRIVKQCCEVCGKNYVHAHHDDYDKPFEVRFLCPSHHREWHVENGEGLNA